MDETQGYAVFFFPQALEVLGDAIKPYLLDGPGGVHVLCREIDTSGAFTEMTLEGRTAEGRDVSLELMVPGSMVRMIVSAHGQGSFGFVPRSSRIVQAVMAPVAGGAQSDSTQPAAAAAGAAPQVSGQAAAGAPQARARPEDEIEG